VDIILVHDGVRPLVDPALILQVVSAARRHGAAILGIPCQDTLKRVNSKGEVAETVDRRDLWQVQTPQAFRASLFWQAYQEAMNREFYATDEAALVEALGKTVVVVRGSFLNLKITTPDDLKMAEAIMTFRECYDASRIRVRRPPVDAWPPLDPGWRGNTAPGGADAATPTPMC
jgi:2-C-methyl-D-erythritol 4-phosphate cytidylyltransferase